MKEKVRVLEDNKEKKEFFREILGIILIFISCIIFSELGIIGRGLKIGLKILLGDWYFLILIVLLYNGIILIFKQKHQNFKNLRFQGIILFFLGIILINHITLNKFILSLNKNPLKGVWNLYLSYNRNYVDEYVYGGGLVGALFFQLFYYLIGDIGLILLSIILIFFGIIFFTNNTFGSFFKKFNFKKIKVKKYVDFFYSKINQLELPKKYLNPKKTKITINNLTDISLTINHTLQKNKSEENKNIIIDILKMLKIEFQFLGYNTGYHYTKYEFKILYDFDILILKEKLKILNQVCYLHKNNNNLMIEINNKFIELVTLKRLIDSNNIPLGINEKNEVINYNPIKNKNIYIIGDKDVGIINFIKGFIISNYIHDDNIIYTTIDLEEELKELKYITIKDHYINKPDDIRQLFEQVNIDLEQKIELFEYLKANTLEEANNKIKNNYKELKLLNRKLIIINSIDEIYQDDNLLNQLSYLLQIGEKFGLNFLITSYNNIYLNPLITNYLQTKLIFKVSNLNKSTYLLKNDHAIYLNGKGEFLYLYENNLERLQAGYISNTDYLNIMKKI